MTCCWPSSSALNVWKNSSCERSLPAKNWMSSISSASSVRYAVLNSLIVLCCSARTMSPTKRSECTYATRACAIARADLVADRVHQVRLAETDAAVDEQRVVGATRVLADLDRRGARELIALAFDESREREVRIETAAESAAAEFPRAAWRRVEPASASDAVGGTRGANRSRARFPVPVPARAPRSARRCDSRSSG